MSNEQRTPDDSDVDHELTAGIDAAATTVTDNDLDTIAGLPLDEQPAAYQRVHDELQRALSEIAHH